MGKNLRMLFFSNHCKKYKISHEISTLKSPQQKIVMKDKNRALQKMAYAILNSKKLSQRLWLKP